MRVIRSLCALLLLIAATASAESDADSARKIRKALAGDGLVERVDLRRDQPVGAAKHRRLVTIELTSLADESDGKKFGRLRKRIAGAVRRFVDDDDVFVRLERQGRPLGVIPPAEIAAAGESER